MPTGEDAVMGSYVQENFGLWRKPLQWFLLVLLTSARKAGPHLDWWLGKTWVERRNGGEDGNEELWEWRLSSIPPAPLFFWGLDNKTAWGLVHQCLWWLYGINLSPPYQHQLHLWIVSFGPGSQLIQTAQMSSTSLSLLFSPVTQTAWEQVVLFVERITSLRKGY